ncbi:unnamed protein product [Closterium sp. Naga37s-1]|nr:unnamed protein product [Closterium sp. Naga37s-1]
MEGGNNYERAPWRFFHVQRNGGNKKASAKKGAEPPPLNAWVLYSGNNDLHDKLWHVLVVLLKQVVPKKKNGVCSCKGECAAVATETIKELKAVVEMLVQQLNQVNARLAAAEKGSASRAEEKNGAEPRGGQIVAAKDKENGVHKCDTHEQQEFHVKVQMKNAAAKEKALGLNVGSIAARGVKVIGELNVKLRLLGRRRVPSLKLELGLVRRRHC